MDKRLEAKLFNDFPKLYRGRNENIQKNLMGFGFAVDNGWYDLIYELSEDIVNYCEQNNKDIPKAFQVKEKFGRLNFYLESADENIRDMNQEAREKSGKICEVCGKEGEIRDGSWIRTLCDEHARELGYTN